MSGLISRQAAIDALVKAIREDPYYDSNEAINGLGVCDVRVILNDLPSAEPEIVRCKNCVNWITGHITEHDDFIPPKCGKYQQMVGHSSDDYCSFAVRKTNEEVD